MEENLKSGILLTGLRLLYILELLIQKNASKDEVLNFVVEKAKIKNYSKETLKLDINSLIKAGFKIKRKGARENFKYELEQTPKLLKFNKEELETLNFIKNAILEVLDYKEILEVKNFIYSNKEFFENNGHIFDFMGFNKVNSKIIEKAVYLIKTKTPSRIIYSSPKDGRKEFTGFLGEITIRGEKLYLSLYDDLIQKKLSLRLDNIKNIEETNFISKKFKNKKEGFRYKITRTYFENNPILKTENLVKIEDDFVEIENIEENEFFVIQRLLTIGKDCVKIYNEKIKEKILKTLNEISRVYQQCQIQ